MFVAELDRPWLDTPFLMQGFEVRTKAEIDALRQHCSHMIVEVARSTRAAVVLLRELEALGRATAVGAAAGASDAQTQAELAAVYGREARAGNRAAGTSDVDQAPTRLFEARPEASTRARPPSDTTPVKRSDVQISPQTRERFRGFVVRNEETIVASHKPQSGLLDRASEWLRTLRRRGMPRSGRPEPASRAAIRAELPRGVRLTEYVDVERLEVEMPRARAALELGESVVGSVMADIRAGRVPDVATVVEVADALVSSMVDNRDALLLVSRLRTEAIDTYAHSVRVALYLIALGRHIGFPQPELVQLATIGMLADVGKLKLPRALLEKPGMLTPAEIAQVKEHVRLGLDTLADAERLPEPVREGIAQHHERLDGSGYPMGLKSDQISLYGRMAAIADSFSALITPRSYASTRSPQDAMMNLFEWAGTSFHEPMVEQFVQAVGVFPVGSLVELSTGEVAIVVERNRARRLEPRVLVLTGPDKIPLPQPVERNLLRQQHRTGARMRIARGLPVGACGLQMHDYFLDRSILAESIPA